MADNDLHEGDSSARRACDQCRLRKIRCDKDSPCANCRTANRACSSTGAGQRPKEGRQRVLISTQYERKIDHFESRLANIEGMIRELAVSVSGRSPSASASATESGAPGPTPGPATSSPATGDGPDMLFGPERDDDAVSAFEGDSSMAGHTVFASEFLEHTVNRTLPLDLDPDMRSALSSLQQIVSMQNRPGRSESRFAHAKPLPKGGVRELPMPPVNVVVGLLREVKDVPLVSFATICTFVATENFTDHCSKVYFAAADYSLMTWGIVNAGLFFLFQERAPFAETPALQAQYLEYQALCRDNLETALANLPLLLPARKESVEVLLLGAFYAIEISKFSLARDLNSIAATLCQTLGYHRLSTPTPDSEGQAVIFWSTYLLDKALSLRSGRAPIIQDYDITVPRSLGLGVVADASWRVLLGQWVAYAEFMGKVYEQLYSPAALARPQEQRVDSARQLVQIMLNLAQEQEPLIRLTREKLRGIKFDANCPFPMDLAILGDELFHWSALTLVYRAIPSPPGSPSTFNPECIHAARQAFALHQEYMEMAGDSVPIKAGCIRWNIIYVPFTPVIILFCHVVETSDAADLRRLADFVASLQPVCAASEAVARLHRVCQVLHNVASLCVRARAAQHAQAAATQQQQQTSNSNGNGSNDNGGPRGATGGGDQQQQQQQSQSSQEDLAMVGSNIDMYLSQLGFMPPVGVAGAAAAGAALPGGPVTGANAQFGGGPGVGAGEGGIVPTSAGSDFAAVATGRASELGNWFSGNTHILGLLEEDLTEFEPRMWS